MPNIPGLYSYVVRTTWCGNLACCESFTNRVDAVAAVPEPGIPRFYFAVPAPLIAPPGISKLEATEMGDESPLRVGRDNDRPAQRCLRLQWPAIAPPRLLGQENLKGSSSFARCIGGKVKLWFDSPFPPSVTAELVLPILTCAEPASPDTFTFRNMDRGRSLVRTLGSSTTGICNLRLRKVWVACLSGIHG